MTDLSRYRSWLALHLLPDVGRIGCNRLVRRFGTPEQALEAVLLVTGIDYRLQDGILTVGI